MMGLRECGPQSSWRENPGSAPIPRYVYSPERGCFKSWDGFLLALGYKLYAATASLR